MIDRSKNKIILIMLAALMVVLFSVFMIDQKNNEHILIQNKIQIQKKLNESTIENARKIRQLNAIIESDNISEQEKREAQKKREAVTYKFKETRNKYNSQYDQIINIIIQYDNVNMFVLGIIICTIVSIFIFMLFFYRKSKIFKQLINLMENLNKNEPFKNTLQFIFDTFSKYIPYTYIGIALLEDNDIIRASYGVSDEHHKSIPKRLLGYKTDIKVTSLAKVLQTGNVRIINDLEKYLEGKKVRQYNKILLEEGIRSSITFPLKNKDKPIGIIFFSSNSKNVYNKKHVEFLKIIAKSITLSLEEDILLNDMIVSSTLAMAVLTEERDPETGEHTERMKEYSRELAECMAKDKRYKDIINVDYIRDIERFSPLHDIGKVAIHDDILLKHGKLTDEEFEIMKTHTVFGGKVLRKAEENIEKRGRSVFKMGIEIAEQHHEKWDGSGYPYGKSQKEIALSARIVAVGDVLDALTSKRPYKKAFSFEKSVDIIAQDSGKHFDPDIISIFLNNIDKFKKIYKKFNTF